MSFNLNENCKVAVAAQSFPTPNGLGLNPDMSNFY